MASFRFGFFDDKDSTNNTQHVSNNEGSEISVVPCEWVSVPSHLLSISPKPNYCFPVGNTSLVATTGNTAEEHPEASQLSEKLNSVTKYTDVLPGVYEGGLKVWECTLDLVQYIQSADFANKFGNCSKLMELGCGHGLPAIAWYKCQKAQSKEAQVVLQDLNKDVLLSTAAPNVILNLGNESLSTFQFLAGDWKGVPNVMETCNADIIISSETVYSTANYGVIIELLRKVLAPGGHALFAGKRYYFGVGGGIESFSDFVNNIDGFTSARIAEFDDGCSNIRDILHVWRIPQ